MPDDDAARGAALDLVGAAREAVGEDRLSGGNCGTFALWLARGLADLGHEAKLGVVYREPEGGAEDVAAVTAAEADVYHVFVECGGRRYDGTGETDAGALLALALDQYGDPDPGYFAEIDPEDRDLLRLIEADTAWDLGAHEFGAWPRSPAAPGR